MEPLFEMSKLSLNNLNVMLPLVKNRLMSGTESAQVCVVEHMIMFLKDASDKSEKDIAVGRLVKLDMISTICDVMETSNEDFVNVVLEYFDLLSSYKVFYDNYAAMGAIESMIKLSYLVSKSRKDSTQFEKLLLGICNIFVRSLKLAVNLDTVCVPKQILSFLIHLDIRDLQKIKLKFAAVTILNVILQQIAFDEISNTKMSIDVCGDALKSMTDIVKHGDEEDMILRAAALLCGICAGASRICNIEENQIDADLNFCQKKEDLSRCIYNTMMSIIIPYVKDTDMSHIDAVEFQKNFIFCLNNLYQLKNCNQDNLSNYLTANGYLKYFLFLLTVQLSENFRRSICTLLSRILCVLGKTAFYIENAIFFANDVRQGFLELPKDSKQWDNVIARNGKDGTSLMILLYYHYQGTQENDIVSLDSLIARIMLLEKPVQTVTILKPLWFLFAVTSLSQPRPDLIRDYEIAVTRLTYILQVSGARQFYTHHIDLLHYCLKCPAISNTLITQILDFWLMESDGDVRPLLSFDCDKVVRRLLVAVHTGHPKNMISLALKGLHHLIRIKDDKYINQIMEIVWHILPNILSSYRSNTAAHIEAVLELANIIRPPTIHPMHLIIRSADSIVNIILKKNIDSNLMTLLVTQAYIVLVISTLRKSLKVLQMYTQKPALLAILYNHGFSEERSQLSAISVKLLAFIVHCQQKFSIKCTQPLIVDTKNLFELLMYARKSLFCVMNGMQFTYELLTQDIDESAVVLRTIATDNDVKFFMNLYEILHLIHFEGYLTYKDMVYQCLIAMLNFAKNKVITSAPLLFHLCTVRSNYDLISHVVNARYISYHFVEFVTVWLHYRKATCNDVLWNPRSLFKSPFDEVLDHLKEYSVIINNKGSEDTYLKLQRALSQFK